VDTPPGHVLHGIVEMPYDGSETVTTEGYDKLPTGVAGMEVAGAIGTLVVEYPLAQESHGTVSTLYDCVITVDKGVESCGAVVDT